VSDRSDVVTCPSCGAQYVGAARACADCGRPFVDGPHLEPTEGEVGYDLGDWGDDERRRLAATLAAEALPSRWEGAELVVRDVDADHVEDLIDQIDDPDALAAEDEADADGGADLLSALYVAADVLQHDPDSAVAVIELLEASELASALGPPYGLDGDLWREVQRRADALADLLSAEAGKDEVMTSAKSLREAVRPLV
jgi:hypothetical protein